MPFAFKEAKAKYTKQYFHRKIEAGLCIRCLKPRDGKSLWRCKACLRKMSAQEKARKQRVAKQSR